MEQHNGRVREARMDLVVHTPSGIFYLDVTCFHPFARTGARRLASAGGSLETQERAKCERYVVRDPLSGARRTQAHFVPVAVSTYGRVGPRALELFLGWEQHARQHKPAFAGRRLGWLARTVSAAAVHGAARGVLDAFSPPVGQERAHLRGAAAA